MHYYYVLRRLSGWRFQPRRAGLLVLGGAGLLLAASLLWQAAPGAPTLDLTWRAPRVSVGSTFAPSPLAAPNVVFKTPVQLRIAVPHYDFFSEYGAYAAPPGYYAGSVAAAPRVALNQDDSTAVGALKNSFYRCWRLVKLGFR